MDDVIRPIRAFGVVLMALGIVGTIFFLFLTTPAPFFNPTSSSFHERLAFYLTASVLIFYFSAGLGVVLLKKWGYYMLKFFLYILFLALPLGPIISYLSLRYMRRHHINRYFGLATQGEPSQVGPLAFPTKVMLVMVVIGSVALYLWMMIAF